MYKDTPMRTRNPFHTLYESLCEISEDRMNRVELNGIFVVDPRQLNQLIDVNTFQGYQFSVIPHHLSELQQASAASRPTVCVQYEHDKLRIETRVVYAPRNYGFYLDDTILPLESPIGRDNQYYYDTTLYKQ